MPDNDDEPITPEVVDGGDGTPRRGASSRKRRVRPGMGEDGPAPDDAPPVPPMFGRREPTGRIFSLAAVFLVGIGVLELFGAVPAVLDPAGARCTSARNAIDLANDNDDEFDDTELPEGAEDAGDIDCDEAISLAGQIPEDEDDEPAEGEEYALTERAIVVQSVIFGVHGIATGVVGFLLRRKPQRRLRNIAVGLAVIGIPALVLLLQLLGLIAIAFIVFGLVFSADAKALFPPDPNKPGLFRPRPPAAS